MSVTRYCVVTDPKKHKFRSQTDGGAEGDAEGKAEGDTESFLLPGQFTPGSGPARFRVSVHLSTPISLHLLSYFAKSHPSFLPAYSPGSMPLHPLTSYGNIPNEMNFVPGRFRGREVPFSQQFNRVNSISRSVY